MLILGNNFFYVTAGRTWKTGDQNKNNVQLLKALLEKIDQ